jgi:arsenical pump membrane protein
MVACGGVLLLVALGVVEPHHLSRAAAVSWRPFVSLASIMVMTEVARRVGLLAWWAARIERLGESPARLFALVFALGVLTSTVLNNDAAILLLTPLVVELVRRRFPARSDLLLPFAFAVFMSAGVAALPISNPMNMVVAEYLGIGFNQYALHMLPVAALGWLLSFAILRRVFAKELHAPLAVADGAPGDGAVHQLGLAAKLMMALLCGVLACYSVIGYLGGPVWLVALCGATLAVALERNQDGGARGLPALVFEAVSWQTLAFLFAVLVLSIGLFEVGLVARLATHYQGAGVGTIGVTSAIGSALLNNHPMSYLNMMALEGGGAADLRVLAALVGGDLGPRLLPIGSLAGLLWLEMLRRAGIEVRLTTFVKVGALVAIPALAASLALLALQ